MSQIATAGRYGELLRRPWLRFAAGEWRCTRPCPVSELGCISMCAVVSGATSCCRDGCSRQGVSKSTVFASAYLSLVRSPRTARYEAMKGPGEMLLYFSCIVPDHSRPEYLATADVDPASQTLGQVDQGSAWTHNPVLVPGRHRLGLHTDTHTSSSSS